jgi:hypothetical protein
MMRSERSAHLTTYFAGSRRIANLDMKRPRMPLTPGADTPQQIIQLLAFGRQCVNARRHTRGVLVCNETATDQIVQFAG